METLNKKKKFQMPHVFAILFAIMILVTVLSYVIPSGAFEKDELGVVNPEVFQFAEQENPIGLMDFFSAIYTGFVEGATIIASLLICSGSLAILNHTGALTAGVEKLTEVTHGKSVIAIVIFYLYFAGMNIMGAGEACYPFFPIVTSIIVSLGYDRMMAAPRSCMPLRPGLPAAW